MKYEIYCDESCIEALYDKSAHEYTVIGGVWIPADKRQEVKTLLKNIKMKYRKHGELKWNKIAPSSVDMYLEVINMFLQLPFIRFRAICVKAADINHERFNNGNGEIGFYKFYFQLIQHWLLHDNEYLLFLDHKVNGYKHRVNELCHILNLASMANVLQAQALPSNQSILIQLADVLTGTVAATFNGNVKGAKKQICDRLVEYIGHPIQGTGVTEDKFNVFEMKLRTEW